MYNERGTRGIRRVNWKALLGFLACVVIAFAMWLTVMYTVDDQGISRRFDDVLVTVRLGANDDAVVREGKAEVELVGSAANLAKYAAEDLRVTMDYIDGKVYEVKVTGASGDTELSCGNAAELARMLVEQAQ